MTDSMIRDYKEIESLYDPILTAVLYPNGPQSDFYTEQDVRRVLDAILNLGKIIGRRTAVKDREREGWDEVDDALIRHWRACVEGARLR